MEKRLYRDELNKKVAGVCAGLADYLSVDVAIIRVCFVLAAFFKGGGLLAYVVLWMALPKKPYNLNDPSVDYTVPPQPDAFNPFKQAPVPPPAFTMPPKKSSSAGLIAGIVLVIMGSFFLLEQFNLIPFLSFHKLWPIILIVVGAGILFSGKENKPEFNETTWDSANKKEEAKFTENDTNPSTDKTE